MKHELLAKVRERVGGVIISIIDHQAGYWGKGEIEMDSIHISWNKLLSQLLLFSPALKEGPTPRKLTRPGDPNPIF